MSIRVWRYLSFARFVWMLDEKALWMSRADQLGDGWEMAFLTEELVPPLAHPDLVTAPYDTPELVAVRKKMRDVRERTYVNCWHASNSESPAMWSVYCPGKEGVAVQTTLAKLKASVGTHRVVKVRYDGLNARRVDDLTSADLVSRKRKPFSYEREYRVVGTHRGLQPGRIWGAATRLSAPLESSGAH